MAASGAPPEMIDAESCAGTKVLCERREALYEQCTRAIHDACSRRGIVPVDSTLQPDYSDCVCVGVEFQLPVSHTELQVANLLYGYTDWLVRKIQTVPECHRSRIGCVISVAVYPERNAEIGLGFLAPFGDWVIRTTPFVQLAVPPKQGYRIWIPEFRFEVKTLDGCPQEGFNLTPKNPEQWKRTWDALEERMLEMRDNPELADSKMRAFWDACSQPGPRLFVAPVTSADHASFL